MKRPSIVLLTLALFASAVAASPLYADELPARLCDGKPVTILGTPGDDLLFGTPGPDVIAGLQGNDTIHASGGDDIVCAGIGNDIVFGDAGFDVIFGAQGDDILYAASGESAALRSDVKGSRIYAGVGNDIVIGSTRWDRMQGGPGNDSLRGHEGRDWMRAGPDRDWVDGGAGIDDMHGGNGRDVLDVTANDLVRGGAGLDQCIVGQQAAKFMRSCGSNVFERPGPPALPPSAKSFAVTRTDGNWAGNILGLVPVEASLPDGGRCYAVLAEVSAASITEGVLTNGGSQLRLGAFVGSEYVRSTDFRCRLTEAYRKGYFPLRSNFTTVGTLVPVAAEIYIPPAIKGDVTAIAVGDPLWDDVVRIPPTIFQSAPPSRDRLPVGPTPTSQVHVGVDARFSLREPSANVWRGTVTAILPAPVNADVTTPGKCYLVLANASLAGQVAGKFDSLPPIGGIAAGRYLLTTSACDGSLAEAFGHAPRSSVRTVLVGVTYEYYVSVFVPDSYDSAISRIIVGNPDTTSVSFRP